MDLPEEFVQDMARWVAMTIYEKEGGKINEETNEKK